MTTATLDSRSDFEYTPRSRLSIQRHEGHNYLSLARFRAPSDLEESDEYDMEVSLLLIPDKDTPSFTLTPVTLSAEDQGNRTYFSRSYVLGAEPDLTTLSNVTAQHLDVARAICFKFAKIREFSLYGYARATEGSLPNITHEWCSLVDLFVPSSVRCYTGASPKYYLPKNVVTLKYRGHGGINHWYPALPLDMVAIGRHHDVLMAILAPSGLTIERVRQPECAEVYLGLPAENSDLAVFNSLVGFVQGSCGTDLYPDEIAAWRDRHTEGTTSSSHLRQWWCNLANKLSHIETTKLLRKG